MDKLSILFLNVNHGDSIVLERDVGGKKYFGLIDSNVITHDRIEIIPALKYFQENDINKLSFLALTHLDFDHYTGLDSILNNISTDNIYLTPHFGNDFDDFKLKKKNQIQKAIYNSAVSTDEDLILKKFESLFNFIRIICKPEYENKCLIINGPKNQINPNGFDDEHCQIYCLHPMTIFKTELYNELDNNESVFSSSIKNNDLRFFSEKVDRFS